jgi:hypothetical protein
MSKLSDYPISGFLKTGLRYKTGMGRNDAYSQLVWTKIQAPKVRKIAFAISASNLGYPERAEIELSGRIAIRKDGTSGNAWFQDEVADALKWARQMPDGRPGLLLRGDEKTFQVFRRAPEALLKQLIDDTDHELELRVITGERLQPVFTDEILIAETHGIRGAFLLALQPDGYLTIVSHTWSSSKSWTVGFNKEAYKNRAVTIDVMLEYQGRTHLRLSEFAGLPASAAGMRLVSRFWKEVNPKLRNRFIEPIHHGIPMYRDLDMDAVKLERSSPEEVALAVRQIALIAIDRRGIELDTGRDYGEESFGIMAATPSQPAGIGYSSGIEVDAGTERLVERIVYQLKPEGAGLSFNGSEPKNQGQGNRFDGLSFLPLKINTRLSEMAGESGHFRMEAEIGLVSFLASIGIPDEEAQSLIDGIGRR